MRRIVHTSGFFRALSDRRAGRLQNKEQVLRLKPIVRLKNYATIEAEVCKTF